MSAGAVGSPLPIKYQLFARTLPPPLSNGSNRMFSILLWYGNLLGTERNPVFVLGLINVAVNACALTARYRLKCIIYAQTWNCCIFFMKFWKHVHIETRSYSPVYVSTCNSHTEMRCIWLMAARRPDWSGTMAFLLWRPMPVCEMLCLILPLPTSGTRPLPWCSHY